MIWGGDTGCQHEWHDLDSCSQFLSQKAESISFINLVCDSDALSNIKMNNKSPSSIIEIRRKPLFQKENSQAERKTPTTSRKTNTTMFINCPVAIKLPFDKIPLNNIGNVREPNRFTFSGQDSKVTQNQNQGDRPDFPPPDGSVFTCPLLAQGLIGCNAFSDKFREFLVTTDKTGLSVFSDRSIGNQQPHEIGEFRCPLCKKFKVYVPLLGFPTVIKAITSPRTEREFAHFSMPQRAVHFFAAISAVDDNTSIPALRRTGFSFIKMRGLNFKESTTPETFLKHNYGICIKCGAVKGDLGLEPFIENQIVLTTSGRVFEVGGYLTHMMQVMAEVWRVLKPRGVAFVNIGDSYATGAGRVGSSPGGGKQGERWKGYRGDHEWDPKYSRGQGPTTQPNRMPLEGIKPKSLCLIPQKFAIKCQEMGWIIRSEIIWAKPNPMPESVKDRPTRSHEQMWMMTKSNKALLWKHRDGKWVYEKPEPDYIWIHKKTDEEQKESPSKAEVKNWKRKNLWSGYSYYWDQEAVLEDINPKSLEREQYKWKAAFVGRHTMPGENRPHSDTHQHFTNPKGRNIRDVWSIAEERDPLLAYLLMHLYSTNPELLGKILSEYTSDAALIKSIWSIATEPTPEAHFATWPSKLVNRMIRAASKPGDIVLDPFCGTAKTVVEAEKLNRVGIGMDLSWEYLSEIAMLRFNQPLQKELAVL